MNKKNFWRVLFVAGAAVLSEAALAEAACPSAGEPIASIEAISYYDLSDPTRSRIDPQRLKKAEKLTAGVNKFVDTVIREVDSGIQAADAQSRRCVEALLTEWAGARALLKVSGSNGQSQVVQQWTLGSLALAKFKFGSLSDVKDEQVVNAWLADIAHQTIAAADARSLDKRGNLYYWAALAVGATGMAVRDNVLWEKSMQMYQSGLNDIDAAGLLAGELKRGIRAAKYHAFAAQPLAVLDLLRRQREPGAASSDPRLLRLLAVVEAEIAGGGQIAQKTGQSQLPVGGQAWLDLWKGSLRGNPSVRRLGGSLKGLEDRLLVQAKASVMPP